MEPSPPTELQDWVERPALRVAYRLASRADPGTLWQAAREIRLADAPVLGRLIGLRIPGVPRELAFDQLFREPPFRALAETEHALISGLVGRIWTLRRDYPALGDAAAFRDWSQSGTCRVLIASWAAPDGDGGAVLHSEARVEPFGVQGRLGVAAVRPLVTSFGSLIGTEALRAAVRRAERSEGSGG